ncbi:MAG: hypothetical protein R3B68_02470 [Phycisphaerales bacterium]
MDRTSLITIGIALAALTALALAAPPAELAELAADWPHVLSLAALIPIAILATRIARLRDACLAALQPRTRTGAPATTPHTLPPTLAILALTAAAAILGPAPAIAPALLASLLAMLALLARTGAPSRLDPNLDLVDAPASRTRTHAAPRAAAPEARRAA